MQKIFLTQSIFDSFLNRFLVCLISQAGPTSEASMVIVKYDYKAEGESELNIKKNERLRLLDSSQHWWQVMNEHGQIGYVPSNHVKKCKNGIFSSLRNTLGRRKSKSNSQRLNLPSTHNDNSSAPNNPVSIHQRSPSQPIIDEQRSHPQTMTNIAVRNGSYLLNQPSGNEMQESTTRSVQTATNSLLNKAKNHSAPLSQSLPSQQGTATTLLQPAKHGDAASSTYPISELCVARYPYNASHSDELTLQRGDEIVVLQKCSDGWWYGRFLHNSSVEGWFPSNYTELLPPGGDAMPQTNGTKQAHQFQSDQQQRDNGSNGSINQPPVVPTCVTSISNSSLSHPIATERFTTSSSEQQLQQPRFCLVRTLYSFSRNQVSELSFEADEVLEIIDKPVDDPEWWLARNSRREVGLVPINYIAVIQPNGTAMPVQLAAGASDLLGPCGIVCMSGEELRRCYNITGMYVDKAWYWGCISRLDCEAMLTAYGQRGQYVVRDSETNPGSLTITMFTGSRCRNFKVLLMDGLYQIGQKTFDRVENLLEYYIKSPIFKSEEETHFLTVPLVHPGSLSP